MDDPDAAEQSTPPDPPTGGDASAPTEPTKLERPAKAGVQSHASGTSARPAARLSELPQVPRGRYRLGAEIGRGGVGRVLEARDLRLDRVVAIKELVLEDARVAARFLQEASIAARLQHPSIVPIYESGRWPDGSAFYAMKLVRGQTLAAAVADAGSFEERAALVGHVLRVADAMGYAHSEQVIHRDLKPANVLVGPFQETVIIDWGLAKMLHDDAGEVLGEEITAPARIRGEGGFRDTLDGEIVGTPSYMPPEQAAADAVDARADVYALGAMLYQVLSGRRPYSGAIGAEVLERLAEGPPTPLSQLVPQVPRDLIAIVDKAMARDPEERYPTAAEMADELRRYATGHLVGAHDYTAWELATRFLARWRGVLYTALAALLVLLAIGAWSIRNISSQRERAEHAAASATASRQRAMKAVAAEQAANDGLEEKVRELVLERARSLLTSDPTLAVATLKQLDRTLPGAASVAAEAEERGVARHVLQAHEAEVEALAASPDGRFVASGGREGRVTLWDGNKQTFSVLEGHTRRVNALAFSADSRTLVSASDDATIRVWNTETGKSRVLTGHTGPVYAIAMSRRAPLIASLDGEGALRLWALTSGQSRVLPASGTRGAVLRFSADGTRLLSGPHGDDLRVWDVEQATHVVLKGPSGRPVDAAWMGGAVVSVAANGSVVLWEEGNWRPRTVARLPGRRATVLAASQRQGVVAVGSEAGQVALVALATGEVMELGAHADRVTALTFSPRGELLVSTGWDKTARLWNLQSRAARVLRGHRDVITSAVLTGDGSMVATAGWDGQVRLWPAEPPAHRALRGHHEGVHAVAFAPDGSFVASGGHDHDVRLWETATGETRVLRGHGDNVFRVLVSPDGKTVASSSDDLTVRLWDVGTLKARVLQGHAEDVEELDFSREGRVLISGSKDATARVWQVHGDGVQALVGHGNDVTDVALDPAGRFAVTASLDESVRRWTLGSPESMELGRHGGPVHGVAISPDGSLVASVGARRLHLWPMMGGAARQADASMPGARHVAFAPDGKRVAVCGMRRVVWLCDTDSLACQTLEGHAGTVWALAFSADGRWLATASADNTVRVWDVASGESRPLLGHESAVFDVAFAPDGRSLASGGADAVVRIWALRPPPAGDRLAEHLGRLTSLVVEQ